MRFDYSCYSSITSSYYYVIIAEPYIPNDGDIANVIGLSLEEYQKILESFNAIVDNKEMVFYSRKNCERAMNYFKEKYEVLLALLGDVQK